MKFLPRAATFAAVTFCAGALANAATLNLAPVPAHGQDGVAAGQQVPVQQHNAQTVQQVPVAKPAVEQQDTVEDQADTAAEPEFASLSDAVAAQELQDADDAQADSELHCLATSIYYEAKGEPLAGQLAVADVVLNRANSGRFPRSICSVVTQPGQFAFVRRGKLPTPPENAQWRRALAVAMVARKDLWESPAGDALYFHTRYSKPGWGRARVATVGNHVFYR